MASHGRQTSIVAYNTIKANGMLSRRRMEAYAILVHNGPMTSNEIAQHSKLHGNPNYRHNTNARMTELRTLGVVAEIGTKQCSVTGHKAILWEVTGNLPNTAAKPARRKSKRVQNLEALADSAITELEISCDRMASDASVALRKELDKLRE